MLEKYGSAPGTSSNSMAAGGVPTASPLVVNVAESEYDLVEPAGGKDVTGTPGLLACPANVTSYE
jgi:hypothetical protein